MDIQPAAVFRALSVDTRLKILDLLKRRSPIGAKELARQLGISTAAVSQHLKILKRVGIVRSRREGYWIPYSIDEDGLAHCSTMVDRICSCPHHGTGRHGVMAGGEPPGHPAVHVVYSKNTQHAYSRDVPRYIAADDARDLSVDELMEMKKHLERKLEMVNRAIEELRET